MLLNVFHSTYQPFKSLFAERKEFDVNSCGVRHVATMFSHLINLPEISDRECLRHRLQFVRTKCYDSKSWELVSSFLLKTRWKKLPLWNYWCMCWQMILKGPSSLGNLHQRNPNKLLLYYRYFQDNIWYKCWRPRCISEIS